MAGVNFELLTPEERLLAEQAVMNWRTLNEACDAAADGKVLAVAEELALRQGREAIRKTIELSLNRQGDGVEKKARRAGSAAAE